MSCGVYVLMFAERFLSGSSLQFQLNLVHLSEARNAIAARLLHAAGQTLTTYKKTDSQNTEFNDNTTPTYEEPVILQSPTVAPTVTEIEASSDESALKTETYGEDMFLKTTRTRRPKRKLSSFVYYGTSKKKKSADRYCICNKPDDGGVYWQCEYCCDWWHPACLGLSLEPEHFYCDECKGKEVQFCETKEEETINSRRQDLNLNTVKDQDSIANMKSPTVTSADIACTLDSVDKYLKMIVECTDDQCEEPEHVRHHTFVNNPREVIAAERRRFAFGMDIFEAEAVETVIDHLLTYAQYDLHPIRPATSARIGTILGVPRQSKLYKLFMDLGLAGAYTNYVLLKEALIYILCLIRAVPYERANELCQKSELDRKQVFGK